MQFFGVKKWCSKHVCWNFVKSERFLVAFLEHIVFNIKWVNVRKISEIIWAKLYCKMCDLFCQFLLPLTLSARKSEIKKNSDDIHWNVWTNIKTSYARNNIFKKVIPNMRFLNNLYFGPNFFFWGTTLGHFLSSVNLGGWHFWSVTLTRGSRFIQKREKFTSLKSSE